MKLRTRLLGGFISIMCLSAILSWATYSSSNSLEKRVDNIVNDRYVKVRLAQHVLGNASQIQNLLNLSVLSEDEEQDEDKLQALLNENNRNFDELTAMTLLTSGKDLLYQAQSSYRTYERRLDIFKTGVSVYSQNENGLLKAIYELESLQQAFEHDMRQYISFQEDYMSSTSAEAFQSIKSAKRMIFISLCIMGILTLAIGINMLRGALRSIRRISATMESFDAGYHGTLPRIPIQVKDEISDIAHSYNRMADLLEERDKREKKYQRMLEAENWVKTNLAELSELYQENRDLSLFCSRLLSKLVPLLDGVCASIYVLDRSEEKPCYVRKAVYAWDASANDKNRFTESEGLLGQCAAGGQAITIEVPEDYIKVSCGLGSASPALLQLVPVPHNGEIIAVLELGLFKPIEGRRRTLLSEIVKNSLGTTIRNMQYQKHVEKLYAESQIFNEELQVQSEELLQQQEALRALNERLEEQVKISDTNSRYKSEFLANMSHELRTPLNSLLVLAQILQENKEGNLTRRQTEYAQTMIMSGNQLLSIINDILDLSKIEAGQMSLYKESFGIQGLLDELNLQFRPLMEEKSLEFSAKAEPRLQNLVLCSDRQRLLQILRNLLSNALKFTEKGGVTLSIVSVCDDPLTIAFAVKDTGIGIEARDQTGIFEAFKQVESNTSRKFGGTGLGLSISQELAALIGGSISVASTPGSGSTFTLTLPVQEDYGLYQAEERLAAAAGEQNEAPQNPEEPSIIMLVDDDMRNIYSLSSVLEEYGYSIVCATNGKEALDLLAKQHVDLLLMDIMMPDMDGYEAMRLIRTSGYYENIPIIAITAKAMKEDRDLCIEAGADDYISKPVRLDKLLSLIRVWLPGRTSP